MKLRFTVAFFGALIASVTSAQVVTDASKVNGLKPGLATPEDVQNAFGVPRHVDKNDDGRFVHLYDLDLKDVTDANAPPLRGSIAFLFDKERKLIRYRVYKQN